MPWGKFRGRDVRDVETSYLVWCIEHADHLNPGLRAAILTELRTRFGAPPPPPPPSASWRRPCPDPALAADIVTTGQRTLAKKHHPDVGGDTALMQRINSVADWLKAQVPQ